MNRRALPFIHTVLFLCVSGGIAFGGTPRYKPFVRGDVDESGRLEVTDAVRIFGYLFLGDPRTLPCEDIADADDSGTVDLSDGVSLLEFLFNDGPPPPLPGAICEPALDCAGIVFRPGYDHSSDDPFECGDQVILGGERAVTVRVPLGYDPAVPTPLLLGLHGYNSGPENLEGRMSFNDLVDSRGFFYALPEGTQDASGAAFWNATDACCNFFGSEVDDVGYLKSLIDQIKEVLNVDPKRVFILGTSNGGFMAHRMACEHPETVAAIVSVSGATFLDPQMCGSSSPVHVLQIHGTADPVADYAGGTFGVFFDNPTWPAYPGARETVRQWAAHNGCSMAPQEGDTLDLVPALPGAETHVLRYESECRPGGSAELWTVEGGGHVPEFHPDGAVAIDWLLAHPKP